VVATVGTPPPLIAADRPLTAPETRIAAARERESYDPTVVSQTVVNWTLMAA
jgi:hypothetical protein